jgi:hypothetical protein
VVAPRPCADHDPARQPGRESNRCYWPTAPSIREPWFDDHVRWDADLISRWRGEQIDFSRRLPSDLICSLAELDRSVMPIVGAYWGMLADPSLLLSIEQRAREALQSGFRPAVPPGPTRDELIDLISSST